MKIEFVGYIGKNNIQDFGYEIVKDSKSLFSYFVVPLIHKYKKECNCSSYIKPIKKIKITIEEID